MKSPYASRRKKAGFVISRMSTRNSAYPQQPLPYKVTFAGSLVLHLTYFYPCNLKAVKSDLNRPALLCFNLYNKNLPGSKFKTSPADDFTEKISAITRPATKTHSLDDEPKGYDFNAVFIILPQKGNQTPELSAYLQFALRHFAKKYYAKWQDGKWQVSKSSGKGGFTSSNDTLNIEHS